MLNQVKASGADQPEINKTAAEMETYKEIYKNPLMVIMLNYAENTTARLLVSLICALLMKRKTNN
ncbi:hypothetical protein BH10BAC3_BH10BAC3_29890 [soil metagenome]